MAEVEHIEHISSVKSGAINDFITVNTIKPKIHSTRSHLKKTSARHCVCVCWFRRYDTSEVCASRRVRCTYATQKSCCCCCCSCCCFW